jgi:plasmid rolling circle replication initiator protein Rep
MLFNRIQDSIDNNSTVGENKSSVFVDKTKTGKVRPWQERKIDSVSYSELLLILEFKKAERVRDCGVILQFKASDTGHLKLYKAWFCKSPLCSLCNWRRAMKHSAQSKTIITEVMKRKPSCRWLFFTFTVKNVYDGEELNQSLSDMARGFRKMVQYKKIDDNLIGFMRTTEVTVNKKDNSYNQHIHAMMCFESSYFRSKKNYITHKDWQAFWKKAMKLDYDPNVFVTAIKSTVSTEKDKQTIEEAVNETAKYSVKSADYLTDDEERNLQIVKDLEEGLHRKRLISYGGLLKEIHKELNLDSAEDGDLVKVNDENDDEKEDAAYTVTAMWNWNLQNYYIKKD